jgi:aspartate/methionine/tyrosine aminotransferase
MWLLNNLYGVNHPHIAELLSVRALAQLPKIIERAKSVLTPNRKLLHDFLSSRSDLQAVQTEFGTTSFPRLLTGSANELCALLHDKYETSVVPGIFFEMEDHFRIGICCQPEQFAAGIERLGAALDELQQ